MKKLQLYFIFLLIILFSSSFISSAETIERSNSYTTSKGTTINIDAKIAHSGLSSGKPIFNVNNTYTLSINVSISALGNEVLDFHDITFEVSVATDPLIGDGDSYYKGYFFDSVTRLKKNENATYNIDMFIAGDKNSADAVFKVKFYGKENIENKNDPSTEYEAISMEVAINPTGSTNNISIGSFDKLNRSVEIFSDKGSKVRFELFMDYEGVDNDTGKPELLSETKYMMTFKTTLLELGNDPNDIHDIGATVSFEDESILDVVPGNDATNYFSAKVVDKDTRVTTVGASQVNNLVFYASTNINNTDVKMNIQFSFKEDVSGIDPETTYDLAIEFILNEGLLNAFDGLRSEADGLNFNFPFLLLLAIPLIRKKVKQNKNIV